MFLWKPLVFQKRKKIKKSREERLQRATLNPLGAFILEPSGKPIS
jgi:hypothetical protein